MRIGSITSWVQENLKSAQLDKTLGAFSIIIFSKSKNYAKTIRTLVTLDWNDLEGTNLQFASNFSSYKWITFHFRHLFVAEKYHSTRGSLKLLWTGGRCDVNRITSSCRIFVVGCHGVLFATARSCLCAFPKITNAARQCWCRIDMTEDSL